MSSLDSGIWAIATSYNNLLYNTISYNGVFTIHKMGRHFMIQIEAGDVDAGEAPAHGGQRGRLRLAHRRSSVGDVTDVADDVGVQFVDAVRHRRGPPAARLPCR